MNLRRHPRPVVAPESPQQHRLPAEARPPMPMRHRRDRLPLPQRPTLQRLLVALDDRPRPGRPARPKVKRKRMNTLRRSLQLPSLWPHRTTDSSFHENEKTWSDPGLLIFKGAFIDPGSLAPPHSYLVNCWGVSWRRHLSLLHFWHCQIRFHLLRKYSDRCDRGSFPFPRNPSALNSDRNLCLPQQARS